MAMIGSSELSHVLYWPDASLRAVERTVRHESPSQILTHSLAHVTVDGLHDAIPYLDMAEIDYRALEMHTALQDILYTLATVYHNLGMEKERDEAASRHQGSVKEQNTLHSLDVNDGWFEILDLVSNISIALTNRQ